MFEKNFRKAACSVLTAALFGLAFTACGDDSSSAPENDPVEDSSLDIGKMTLREKVGQMFFVRPEALDTSIHWEAYTDLPDFKLQQVNKTMTAHIAAPKVTGEDIPATLSSVILQDKLRGELGFEGVIVLCSREFVKVFDAVVEAVEKGDIKESRINESVKRILALKK